MMSTVDKRWNDNHNNDLPFRVNLVLTSARGH